MKLPPFWTKKLLTVAALQIPKFSLPSKFLVWIQIFVFKVPLVPVWTFYKNTKKAVQHVV